MHEARVPHLSHGRRGDIPDLYLAYFLFGRLRNNLSGRISYSGISEILPFMGILLYGRSPH